MADNAEVLTADGWTITAGAAKSTEHGIVYTHRELAGHRIELDAIGDGWRHFDPDGFLIGHSRLRRRLADHLRYRYQF